jgi:hypothetical protein
MRCPVCKDFELLFIDGVHYPFPCECLCGWNGYYENLISEEEYKNIKRTEIIDKILE